MYEAGSGEIRRILERLDRTFHKTYWRSKARINSHIVELSGEGP